MACTGPEVHLSGRLPIEGALGEGALAELELGGCEVTGRPFESGRMIVVLPLPSKDLYDPAGGRSEAELSGRPDFLLAEPETSIIWQIWHSPPLTGIL